MRTLLLIPALAVLSAPLFAAPRTNAVKPVKLTCEYLTDPIVIDRPNPRLSWQLVSTERGQRQTGYQVLVASDPAKLRADRGDLWDSGKVLSENTLFVPYGGAELKSGQPVWWKVRAWDRDGKETVWSPVARWSMGLLRPEDWRGKWIGRTEKIDYEPAPLFRKEFELTGRVKRAVAYVCGLGYHELRLNGKKVGDALLEPGYTRYDRRALYVAHDVTAQLKEGKNALGAMLGTGWYNPHVKAVWYFDRAPWRAAPKLLLDLRVEFEDGRTQDIGTDSTWKTATGPITFDSIYAGESYDARKERPGWDAPGYDETGWEAAKMVRGPGGVVAAQMNPPIRATQELKPVKLTEPKPGVFVFDVGQNLSGHARLSLKGPAGTTVSLRYGEKLNADGTLDQSNLDMHLTKSDAPKRFQTDTYTLKGQGREEWEARFTYHGFQYVEVTGFPGRPTLDSLRAVFTHSDVEPTGTFACSDELFNRIQTATRWSFLSNFQGIPTDCPHREKNGWTGDAHLAAEQALFNFAPGAVYTKWIQDLADEQRPTGDLPGIVPSSGWGYEWGNGPAWDSAFLLIPDYVLTYNGDPGLLTRHYAQQKRYVDYLTTKADNGIVSIGLGDWVPWESQTPEALTSTGYYYADTLIVAKAARLLGLEAEAERYSALALSIRRAFNTRFFDPKTGLYDKGQQTALACALAWGLVPKEEEARVLDNLVKAVEKRNFHIDTGILGAKYLLNTLLEHGRADVAYKIVAQKDKPGWGWWLEQGATTLWESWNGTDSRNHIMFGDVSAWFYKALAGIVPDVDAPGFRRFTVRPCLVGDLTWAKADYDSARGKIASAWKKEASAFTLTVTVPANSTATVYVPAADVAKVTESGKPVQSGIGFRFLEMREGCAVFEVGSGEYIFRAD